MSEEPETHKGELDGQTLGSYEIIRQVGQGGMATVYLANQTSIGRTVAIKVMPMYFMHDPSFLQRFEREAQVIAKLQHPRILPVYDYGQVEGRPYIVMAYLPGGTLTDRIAEGPLSIAEIVRYTEQMAEGLDYAHREGIIHRDFKPSNVLLDKAGNVHLADFGIAKISEATVALTGSGVVGTPAYMAPEMASEGTVTPAVDIYAMGVTLYQMFTGDFPYRGETPLKVMMAHATEPVPDVRVARPDLPTAITDVIQRAMAKDPMDRFPTAAELAAALRAAARESAPAVGEKTVIEDARTVIEDVPAYAPAIPPRPGVQTPPPSATPPPPRPAVARPEVAPEVEGKRGCRPVFIIGGVIVGLGALVCGGIILLGGIGAIFGSPATPTPLPPTAVPTDVVPPTDVSPPTAAGTNLNILNNSDSPLCYVYAAQHSGVSWGDDQLGTTDVIAAGGSFTVSGLLPGQYDILTEDCDFNVIAWQVDVAIDPAGSTLTVNGSDHKLYVINNASDSLCTVNLSPPGSGVWGPNLVDPRNPIPIGSTRYFVATADLWDMRATTCDDRSAERYGEDLTGENEWTITD